MLSIRALLLGILFLGVAACSPSDGTFRSTSAGESSSPSIGSRTSPAPFAASDGPSAEPLEVGWAWESGTDHGSTPATEGVDPVDGPADGEPLGDVTTDGIPVIAVEEGHAAQIVDPCSLVLAEEWADWSGGGTIPEPQRLEDGDACGWIAAGDQLRMAVGLFAAGGDGRWLSAGDLANASRVPGIGDSALWLQSWPVVQSSTLVVAVGHIDLVIEMSALTADEERMLDGATHFAELILDRIR